MNTFFSTLLVAVSLFSFRAFSQEEITGDQVQQWVLDSVNEMPSKGGYVLTKISPERLRDAFTLQNGVMTVDEVAATPSYCTTSTFIVLYKVLQKYWDYSRVTPSTAVLEMIKPNVEMDGVRIWGRWNSNGPATAKFFNDARIGQNFDDINQARPGDFLKMFWNGQVGKTEQGHSVVFLGQEKVNGVMMIKFWSSNKTTDGYGVRWVPVTDAKRMVFSRLTNLQNFENIAKLPETDDYLASMLSKSATWDEVRRVTGIQALW